MKSIVQPKTKAALLTAFVFSLSLAGFSVRAEEAESKITIPATIEDIWKSIDQEMATLDQLITSNKLTTVHQHAYAIRDLVAALVVRPGSVSAADQQKLASESKFVAALASRLDESGDSGDQSGARSNYDKLKALIAGIRLIGQHSGGK